jgi:NitT/TauT family transport system substrate-binding protein
MVAAVATFGLTIASSAQGKLTVMTDWAAHGMHAGLFLAQEKGWYKEAGLDVDIQDGKGSQRTIELVGTGNIDVGFAQLSIMTVARSQGVPVKAIAVFIRNNDNGVMFAADSDIKTLADLEGKTVAYTAGSGDGSFVPLFLKMGGADVNKVNLVNVDSSALVSMYTAGNVDATMSTVAFLLPIVKDEKPSKGITWGDVGLVVPGYGLVATLDTIAKRNEELKKFVAVTLRAWQYIFDGHQDEGIDAIVSQRPGERLDKVILRGQLDLYMPLFFSKATEGKPLGWMAPEDWEATVKNMETAGVLQPGSNPADNYTNEFIPVSSP